MKRLALSFFALFASSTLGCGMMMPGPAQGPGGGDGQGSAPGYTVPKETKDAIRDGERKAYAQVDDMLDEQLDNSEKEALVAVKVSLGQEKWSENQPAPRPASQGIAALKKAHVKMRLEPVMNAATGQQNDDFLQLKDAATDRVTILGRKMAEQGRLSPAETREMQAFSKNSFKLMDLRMQVSKVSVAAVMANSNVQSMGLQQMLRVSSMVRSHKLYSMEMTPEDYALVKRGLERQKRAEAIAATTMALLAAYQAVINDGGDPKALDVIAKGTLEAFPIKPSVTDDDAKQYVSALGENVSKMKARYEAQMRKTWGDAKYEKQFKSGIDAMFAQAEGAKDQKSIGQMVSDNSNRYQKDVAKCMRGEDAGPGSMVGGGTCKSLARAAQTGDTSDLPPGAKQAFDQNGGASGASAGGSAPNPALKGKAGAALEGASALANGDAGGALDAAAKMFPGDSTIGASLQGIAALRKGDAKGAINAALSFVPVPGLKDAFGFAAKLLFKG